MVPSATRTHSLYEMSMTQATPVVLSGFAYIIGNLFMKIIGNPRYTPGSIPIYYIDNYLRDCNDELATNVGGCDAWRDLNVDENYVDWKTAWGKLEEIEAVVQAAKAGKTNDPKATLLHWAARCNKTWPISQFLTDPACDVMALDSEGRTALEMAIEFNITGRFCASAKLLKAHIEKHNLVKPIVPTKSTATSSASFSSANSIPVLSGKASANTVASQKELAAAKAAALAEEKDVLNILVSCSERAIITDLFQYYLNKPSEKYDTTLEDSNRVTAYIDNKSVTIEWLDTAGQEELSSMRDHYLRKADIHFVCFVLSDRRSFDYASSKLERIQRVVEISILPVVLVGTQCHLPNREITRTEAEALANAYGIRYFEISVETNIHVKELFEYGTRSAIYGWGNIEKSSTKPKFTIFKQLVASAKEQVIAEKAGIAKAEPARLEQIHINAEKEVLAKQVLADKEATAAKEKAAQALKVQQAQALQAQQAQAVKDKALADAQEQKAREAKAESARLEQLRLDAEKAALAKQALAEREATAAKEKAAQALKVQQAKEAQAKEIQAKKEAEAIAAKEKAEQKVITEIAKLSQEIQSQNPSIAISPENILALNAKLEILNQKIADLQSSQSTQLTPQNQKILDQLAKDEVWLTLLRFGQGLQQQDKTLEFFQRHPVLWETYLTLITILSNQFLSAKILHSKILDMKAKGWFKEQGVVSNLSDAFASQVTNLADLANIPLLSGAAKGFVKAYDSYSQHRTRELFNPLIEYAPTLTDQDKLIQQIAFLTLARFHELLLLAEKVDSKNLLNSLGNSISKKLKLGELKQKFNDLLKREETAEKKDASAAAMGTLFGEFFADKLMEIILSEYEETAYNKAKKTRDFGDLILAWLRSDTWDTHNVSVAGKEYDVESTKFAKLLHANDAKIIWDSKQPPMTIVEAMRVSGFKHYQPTTQWAYKTATTDQPETVGYLYEMNPGVFESELFLASNKHATFSTRETKAIIIDAESHYASLPVLVSTAANVANSTPSLRSSSSPTGSFVDESVSTEAALSNQEIMLMFAQMEMKHREQATRMAAIEADKKASEEKNKALVRQLEEAHAKTIQLETKMKKVEKKVSVLDDVDDDIDVGDGQVFLKKTKITSSTAVAKSTSAQSDRAAIAQLTERLNDQATVVATIAEHTGLGFLSKPKKEPTAQEERERSELLSLNSPR